MLGSLVRQLVQLHRIVSTRALAFGKRNELRKDFVMQNVRVFESKMASVSVGCGIVRLFLGDRHLCADIPGVVNASEP